MSNLSTIFTGLSSFRAKAAPAAAPAPATIAAPADLSQHLLTVAADDRHALAALAAYARSCEHETPVRAQAIRTAVIAPTVLKSFRRGASMAKRRGEKSQNLEDKKKQGGGVHRCKRKTCVLRTQDRMACHIPAGPATAMDLLNVDHVPADVKRATTKSASTEPVWRLDWYAARLSRTFAMSLVAAGRENCTPQ